MGLAPEDEDLSHHPEELSGACIRLLQPPGPGVEEKHLGYICKSQHFTYHM